MDELTRIALVGTSKSPGATITQDEVADGGIAALTTISTEEQILLRAGARSLHGQAGVKPLTGIKPLDASPPETEPQVPATSELLLLRGWDQQSVPLLQSLLRELQLHKVILPAALLTRALNERDGGTRELVQPLLGNRGRWLAALNPAWSRIVDSEAMPDDVQDIIKQWEECSTSEQVKALRAIRPDRPAVARDLVTKSFSKASADGRLRLLEALQAGLSRDDEEFIERCLDDRAPSVREFAAALLVLIPQSACSRRMIERADAILSLETKGMLRKKQIIKVTPPQDVSEADERDGIAKKSPDKRGKRAYWTTTILGCVPLDHWTARFNLAPDAIVAAVADDEYCEDVIQGWLIAACDAPGGSQCSPEWAQALLDASREWKNSISFNQLRSLARTLPPEAAAETIELAVFGDRMRTSPAAILQLLLELAPWTPQFALAFLRRLDGRKDWSDPKSEWLLKGLLSTAEVGLPIEMLPEVSKFVATQARPDRAMSEPVRQAMHTLEDRVRLRAEFRDSLNRSFSERASRG